MSPREPLVARPQPDGVMEHAGAHRPTGLRRAARVAARATAAALVFALIFPPLYAVAVPERRPALALAMPLLPDDAVPFTVTVADWGYHTSVTLPQPAGWRLGPPGAESAPYVEYAWGDRRFYRDSDYRPQSLFATLALPTSSVVYVAGRSAPPRDGPRATYMRRVDARTLRALVETLERSIVHEADGRRTPASPPVAGYAGRFYPAHGAYLWARDCNWWTVRRLADAGLARGPGGVVLPGQVPGRLLGFRLTR